MFGGIGTSTWTFVSRPILDSLEPIERMGFKSVEVWGVDPAHFNLDSSKDVMALRDHLSAFRLRPESLHMPFRKQLDISSLDPKIRAGAVRTTIRHLRAASKIPVEEVVVHPGHARQAGEEPRRFKMAVASLERICSAADALGIRVSVENLHSMGQLAFCDTLPKTLHLVRSVEGFAPGICADTSHANLMGGVAEEIEICGASVRRTHISDNLGHDDDHLPPGDGHINWQAVLTSLKRISYQGSLMLEISGHDGPERVLSRAQSNLKSIISEWRRRG